MQWRKSAILGSATPNKTLNWRSGDEASSAGLDRKNSQRRTVNSDLYYGSITAFDTINHKVIAKALTDIEIRSGARWTRRKIS